MYVVVVQAHGFISDRHFFLCKSMYSLNIFIRNFFIIGYNFILYYYSIVIFMLIVQ